MMSPTMALRCKVPVSYLTVESTYWWAGQQMQPSTTLLHNVPGISLRPEEVHTLGFAM
jgi:hypothetical protein